MAGWPSGPPPSHTRAPTDGKTIDHTGEVVGHTMTSPRVEPLEVVLVPHDPRHALVGAAAHAEAGELVRRHGRPATGGGVDLLGVPEQRGEVLRGGPGEAAEVERGRRLRRDGRALAAPVAWPRPSPAPRDAAGRADAGSSTWLGIAQRGRGPRRRSGRRRRRAGRARGGAEVQAETAQPGDAGSRSWPPRSPRAAGRPAGPGPGGVGSASCCPTWRSGGPRPAAGWPRARRRRRSPAGRVRTASCSWCSSQSGRSTTVGQATS